MADAEGNDEWLSGLLAMGRYLNSVNLDLDFMKWKSFKNMIGWNWIFEAEMESSVIKQSSKQENLGKKTASTLLCWICSMLHSIIFSTIVKPLKIIHNHPILGWTLQSWICFGSPHTSPLILDLLLECNHAPEVLTETSHALQLSNTGCIYGKLPFKKPPLNRLTDYLSRGSICGTPHPENSKWFMTGIIGNSSCNRGISHIVMAK